MARAKIKADDVKKIKLFLNLCGGSIDFEAGSWYLEAGGKLKILHSVQDLNDFIGDKLDTMREDYTAEAWEKAEQDAEKTQFHLKGESDRIDRRRYRHGER